MNKIDILSLRYEELEQQLLDMGEKSIVLNKFFLHFTNEK